MGSAVDYLHDPLGCLSMGYERCSPDHLIHEPSVSSLYSLFIRGLTRTINRKSFEDRQLEEELNLPFYVPSPDETLDQEAYFCALRVAIKQLDLAKRALAYDIRIKAQVKEIRFILRNRHGGSDGSIVYAVLPSIRPVSSRWTPSRCGS
jgi:hypothetical protein